MTLDAQVAALSATDNLIWAPIRHHSPQCSWQLRRLIKEVRPEVVLIEGPAETNPLLPQLLARGAKPPLAFYLFVVKTVGRAGEPGHQRVRYRCFVPFAGMSPEWVALQTAAKLGMATRFIDLPYQQRLECNEERARFSRGEEQLLYDDGALTRADPMAILTAQADCRGFDEWWDRFFESGQDYSAPRPFFADLLRMCLFLRHGEEARGPLDEETLIRESYMAEQIRPYLRQGKRCLVVCGGFHCSGIAAHLKAAPQPLPPPATDVESGAYLVPYALQRLNKASGYQAGLPDCGYYALAWEKLKRRKKNGGVWRETAVDMVAALAEHARQAGYPISLPDAIEAAAMAQRLAGLRGINPGRMELRDAIVSSFVKEAIGQTDLPIIALVNQYLAGDQVGKLPKNAPIAPLVKDFRRQCCDFSLSLSQADVMERSLELYRRERHRTLSCFLHQLAFLEIPYGQLLAGPCFATGEALQRVREVWALSWQIETEASLAERADYGADLAEAALNRALEQLADPLLPGADKVALLVSALAMGLHPLLDPIMEEIRCWLTRETDLAVLCAGLHHLVIAFHSQTALQIQSAENIELLMAACFERLCVRLPWLTIVPPEQIGLISDVIIGIHGLIVTGVAWCQGALFYEALAEMMESAESAQLHGVALGVLFAAQRLTIKQLQARMMATFGHARIAPAEPGQFLQGLLTAAHSRIAQEPQLLSAMGKAMLSWEEAVFLAALPELRLAFTHLSPRELKELAACLTREDGVSGQETARQWNQESLVMAMHLRQQLAVTAKLWGQEDE